MRLILDGPNTGRISIQISLAKPAMIQFKIKGKS